MLLKGGNIAMKQKYIQPELMMIKLMSTDDILTASDEEVFVDGGDLFGE